MPYKIKVGDKFSKWTVICEQFVEKEASRALCKCDCGTERIVRCRDLIKSWSKSCGCLRLEFLKTKQFKGVGELGSSYWSTHRPLFTAISKRTGDSTLSITEAWDIFLKQNRKCALSGVDLYFKYPPKQSASLDRIDSSKGYTKENCQWVHKDVNKMKNDLPEKYFIEFCKKIVDHQLCKSYGACPIK